jgi:hypothetical protein
MNIKKLLAGGVAGGIAYFLLGWLIYGMALKGFMEAHQVPGIMKSEAEFMGNMHFMVISNLILGLMIAYIYSLANINSLMEGLKVGLIFGLLMALSFDLMMFAMSNMFDGMTSLAVDIAASTVFTGLGAAVVGFVNSKVS